MAAVRVLVLRAAGINCDEETAFGWEQAGAAADRVHVNRLFENRESLADYQVMCIPGGFSHGDHIAAGVILGNRIARWLGDEIAAFIDRGGLVLGICNGFQVLVRAGLLPGPGCAARVTLTLNASGRYEDRWVRLKPAASHCAFLDRDERYEFPVGHAEGRVAVSDETALTALETANRIALRYVGPADESPGYPGNPNGSIGDVAGLTDATGRVLGLMPHPDRFLHATNHPAWTRRGSTESGGSRFFRRAVAHFA